MAAPTPRSSRSRSSFKGAWLGETGYEVGPDGELADPACKFERVAWFSVNVDAYRQPRKVELYRANGRYPNINADDPRNELLHERLIDPVDVPSLLPMHCVGGAQIDSEAGVNVDRVCDGLALRTEDFRAPTCRASAGGRGRRSSTSRRPRSRGTRRRRRGGAPHETFTVPVTNEAGATYELTPRAQRWVSAPGVEGRGAPLADATPWIEAQNAEQSLRVWAPHDANADLPEGVWTAASAVKFNVMSVERGAPSIRRASSTPSM